MPVRIGLHIICMQLLRAQERKLSVKYRDRMKTGGTQFA